MGKGLCVHRAPGCPLRDQGSTLPDQLLGRGQEEVHSSAMGRVLLGIFKPRASFGE